jgi:pyruvyl transferase EpsI
MIHPFYVPIYRKIIQPISDIQKQLSELRWIMDTRIWKAEQLLESRVAQMEHTMNERVAQAEWTVDRRIAQVEQIVDERIAQAEQIVDGRIGQAEQIVDRRIAQTEQIVDERIAQAEQIVDGRIGQAEQIVDRRIAQAEQTLDERITQTEQTMDGRIAQAEQTLDERITQTEQAMDGRIAQAEQTADGRIAQAEQTADGRVWKAEQNIITVTDGRIWKAENTINANIQNFTRTYYIPRKKAVLLGTPEHNNIGDHAIAQGEYEFLRRYFPDHELFELMNGQMSAKYGFAQSVINKDDILFLSGGGNLGSLYLDEEEVRRRVIEDFPENQIVILPQTVYFAGTDEGRAELERSAAVYNRHKNLTIFTRGEESLAFVKARFPNAKSYSAPDMSLILARNYGFERAGILACIRALEDESGIDEAAHREIERVCRKYDENYERTDNLYDGDVAINVRGMVVNEQLKKFARRKVVVTDRLHGMLFSVITGTPCVVISAMTQKIREYVPFFEGSNAVFFVDKDIAKLEQAVEEAMKIEMVKYPQMREYGAWMYDRIQNI